MTRGGIGWLTTLIVIGSLGCASLKPTPAPHGSPESQPLTASFCVPKDQSLGYFWFDFADSHSGMRLSPSAASRSTASENAAHCEGGHGVDGARFVQIKIVPVPGTNECQIEMDADGKVQWRGVVRFEVGAFDVATERADGRALHHVMARRSAAGTDEIWTQDSELQERGYARIERWSTGKPHLIDLRRERSNGQVEVERRYFDPNGAMVRGTVVDLGTDKERERCRFRPPCRAAPQECEWRCIAQQPDPIPNPVLAPTPRTELPPNPF